MFSIHRLLTLTLYTTIKRELLITLIIRTSNIMSNDVLFIDSLINSNC